jgi:hypothetical protein
MRTSTRIAAGVMALGTAAAGVTVASSGSAAPQPAKAVHTIRLVAHSSTDGASTGPRSFVGADTDRSPRTHKIVGYDSITGTFNQSTGKATIIGAFALKGGTIEARFRGTSTSFHGTILNGTGKYAGITGTATATSPTQNSDITHVTLRYS